MKTAISRLLYFASTLVVVQLGLNRIGHAQRMASAPFESFFEEVGIMVDETFVPISEATEQQLAVNPPLFENHSENHLPVLMPDGTTPIGYDQFGDVTGTASIVDVGDRGTQVTLSLDNLIPGGVYTVWADYYKAPGFTPDFAHELALGALGFDTNDPLDPNAYVGNVITADSDGHGELEAMQRAGPASWFTTDVIEGFEVPAYVLDPPVSELDLVVAYHIDGKSWGPRAGQGEGFDAFDATWVGQGIAVFVSDALQAGDADQNHSFDQDDLVLVQQAGKYRTGGPATWGQGDWDGAPGGNPGEPPSGNGVFDQFDVIAAQRPALYLAGPYATLQPGGQNGDGQTSVVYSPTTGELTIDAPAGVELTSFNIDSAAGIFTGSAAQNLGGSFDNDADANIFKATFGSSFGSLSFGNVAQVGLAEDFVLGDLSVIGSLAGGGDLGAVDLIYVPEPTTALLLALGLAIGILRFERAHRRDSIHRSHFAR